MTMRVQFPTHPITGVTAGQVVVADPTKTSGIGFAAASPSVVPAVTIASGYWWPLSNWGALGTLAGASLNGYEFVFPFFVNQTQTIKALECETTVAASSGGTIRMGIRNNTSGLPGTVIVDGGGAVATSVGMISTGTLGSPPELTSGWYFGSLTLQGAPSTMPTIRVNTGGDARFPITTNAPAAAGGYFGYYQSGVTGALPSTFTPSGYLASVPRIFAQEN